MKRIISLMLVAVFLLLLVPVFGTVGASGAETDAVVYLNGATGSDSNNGKTASTPVATLYKAISVANTFSGADKVTVVVTGVTAFGDSRDYILPANSSPITVTSVYGGTDYRKSGAYFYTYNSNISTVYFNGPFTFENVKFNITTTNSIFAMQYNNFTIGEGVETVGADPAKSNNFPILLVGCNTTGGVGFDKAATPKTFTNSVKLEVNSGTWAYVRGGDRDSNSTFNGRLTIDINGGKFLNPIVEETGYLTYGNTNGATGKCIYGSNAKIVMNLRGGEMNTLVGANYVGENSGHTSAADITVNFFDGFKLTEKFAAVQTGKNNVSVFNGKLTVNLYGGDLSDLVQTKLSNPTTGSGTVYVNYDAEDAESAAAYKALTDVCVGDDNVVYGTLPEFVEPEEPEDPDNNGVLYENDFSDAATLNDFKQYRGKWAINNGKLWLTAPADNITAADTYSFILLNKNVDWKNYVVEADIENVQTSTGIVGHANINLADSSTADSFAGVVGFISNDATKGAIGRSDPQNYTGWAGNYTDSVIDTGTAPGSSVHLKMTFNNNMITLEIFDLETEERIYHFVTYASDWTQGTVGFRVRFMYNATQKSSFNTVAFDNLKVTELVESETGGQIAGGSCGNNVTWKLYDDGSLVISGSGEMKEYNINGTKAPWYTLRDTITKVTVENGVKTVGSFAFYDCENLAEVNLPNSIEMIGEMAFWQCKFSTIDIPSNVGLISAGAFKSCENLKTVHLPASLVYIPGETFMGCYRLESITVDANNEFYESVDGVLYDKLDKILVAYPVSRNAISYTIPAGTREIDAFAFYWTFLEDVEFPSSLTEIGQDAFGFSSLNGVLELPEGLVTIGKSAFSSSSGLTSVKIPSTVTSIGSSAFSNCQSITEIEVADGNTAFKDVDGVLYSADMKKLVLYPAKKAGTTFVIPEGVTTINGRSVTYARNLTSVKFPSTLKTIGDYAFYTCTSLTSIELPEALTSIGYYAFSQCKNLATATVKATDNSFATGVFNGTANGFTMCGYAGSTAQSYATANGHNFASLASVVNSGTCGADGDNLTWVLYSDGELVISGSGAMKNYSSTFNNRVPWITNRSDITSVRIDSGVTSIGGYAFYACSNLTSIEIPESVTAIGNFAFEGCSNLGSIEIPENVTTIGNSAFQNCSNLTSIDIPVSVTDIGGRSFFKCSKLNSVTVNNGIALIGASVFDGTASDLVIYGGENSTAERYADDKNHSFEVIELPDIVLVSGECGANGDNLIWSLYNNGRLVISGNGAMKNYSDFAVSVRAPWNLYNESITSVTIESGVTTIGDHSFAWGAQFTSIEIPASITSIGDSAFENCSKLNSVTVNNGNATFGSDVFSCTASDLVIYGKNNSTAQQYASSNNHKFVPLLSLNFAGASLTLENNISINYRVSKSDFDAIGYTDPYVVFEFNGSTTTVSDYTVEGDRYVFTFKNISPNKMGDILSGTLFATYDGKIYSSKTRDYSITQYCYSMLERYTGNEYAEFRTMLVDLLHYGAKAQLYTNYKCDQLVDAALTETQLSYGTNSDPVLDNHLNTKYNVIEAPIAKWRGASLLLNDSVTVQARFEAESIDGLSVKIVAGGKTVIIPASKLVPADVGGYYVRFSGLNAGQFSEKIYLTVMKGDVAVSNTVQYSIETYAHNEQDNENTALGELVKAMMNYGNAARAYAN